MKRVHLPVKGRDPKRVARRLQPEKAGGLYVLLVCRGLECRKCVFHEPPRIVFESIIVDDPLSSLRMRLRAPRAEYCGRTLWEARWEGGMLVVDRVQCPSLLPNGCIDFWGEEICGEPGTVLAEKCGVSDAGRGHSPG